jgi:uncharacterized protein YjbI with pentapeptide repeats
MGRSCRASTEGLLKAKNAFSIWGKTQDYLAGAAGCDRSVVIRFFARRPIEKRLFQAICTELKLEWGEIAELEESESTVGNIMNVGLKVPCDNNPDFGTNTQVLVSEIPSTVENHSAKAHQARIVLSAKLTADNKAEFEDKKEEIEAIIAHLRQLLGDVTLTIQDIQKGSIKITLNGSPEGLEKLHELFESGELVEVLGIRVDNVELLTLEDIREDFKLKLIERIIEGEDLGDDLVGADLRGAFLSGVNLRKTNLRRANLTGANLTGANLTGANLVRANLQGANLERANLRGANLRGAKRRANPWGADLRGANITGADITGADLTGAYLVEAILVGANLTGAYLERANLTGADLERANLTGADLERANLTGADLERANLTGAYLERAYLTGANLVEANLENAIVKDALFHSSTGITEETKRELESRGAIFADRPPVKVPT